MTDAAEHGPDQPITVHFKRRGVTIEVPPGMSILMAMRANRIPAPSSCESGMCGACALPVLQGIPEHRDHLLTDDCTDEIMTCVSRARTRELVIDY